MFGVATSEHPVAAHAVAECAGVLLEAQPEGFEAILCVASTRFEGALEDITAALGALLGAADVAAVVGHGVLMGERLGWDTPGLAVVAVTGPAMRVSDFDPGDGADLLPGLDIGDDPTSANGVVVTRAPADGSIRIVLPKSPRNPQRRAVEFHGPDPDPAWPGASVVGRTSGRSSARAEVVALSGVATLGHEVIVTEVEDGQLVALDGLPATEFFESMILGNAEGALDGATEVGFTNADDDTFVAVRASSIGLATSRPVSVGTTLVPAARGTRLLFAELSRQVCERGEGVVLAILDESVVDRARTAGPAHMEFCGVPVAGITAGRILYGPQPDSRFGTPGAIVVRVA